MNNILLSTITFIAVPLLCNCRVDGTYVHERTWESHINISHKSGDDISMDLSLKYYGNNTTINKYSFPWYWDNAIDINCYAVIDNSVMELQKCIGITNTPIGDTITINNMQCVGGRINLLQYCPDIKEYYSKDIDIIILWEVEILDMRFRPIDKLGGIIVIRNEIIMHQHSY